MSSDPTRRLVVLRHAKSSWKSGASTDHARPLNKRGRRDAPRVAEVLVERGWIPDRVLSSDSTRTRETWQLFAPIVEAHAEPEVDFRSDFYEAGVEDILEALEALPDSVRCAYIVGHNPTLETLVEGLVRSPQRITTCNAVLLQSLSASWPQALVDRWKIVDHIRPRELSPGHE